MIEGGIFASASALATASGCAFCEAAITIVDVVQTAISLFGSGRPKMQATENVAQSMLASPNPTVRLYGLGLYKLASFGIPISASTGSGRMLLDRLASAVAADVNYQFGPTEGRKYFASLVNYAFNFCSAAGCQSVLARDPTFRSWVQRGLLRGDGFPLWRQPKAVTPTRQPAVKVVTPKVVTPTRVSQPVRGHVVECCGTRFVSINPPSEDARYCREYCAIIARMRAGKSAATVARCGCA